MTPRCHDCLHEFQRTDAIFVIKLYDPDGFYYDVFLCADCAGWYSDAPVAVTFEEVEGDV